MEENIDVSTLNLRKRGISKRHRVTNAQSDASAFERDALDLVEMSDEEYKKAVVDLYKAIAKFTP